MKIQLVNYFENEKSDSDDDTISDLEFNDDSNIL